MINTRTYRFLPVAILPLVSQRPLLSRAISPGARSLTRLNPRFTKPADSEATTAGTVVIHNVGNGPLNFTDVIRLIDNDDGWFSITNSPSSDPLADGWIAMSEGSAEKMMRIPFFFNVPVFNRADNMAFVCLSKLYFNFKPFCGIFIL